MDELSRQAEGQPRLGLTQRQFAERLGVSEAWISKCVREGRIHRNVHGRIDPDEAEEMLIASRDPAADLRRLSLLPGVAQSTQELHAYQKARTLRMVYQAKKEQIEFEKENGELVRKDEVSAAFFAVARTARDKMLLLPERLAPELAGIRAHRKIVHILKTAIEEAMAGLLDTDFADLGAGDGSSPAARDDEHN